MKADKDLIVSYFDRMAGEMKERIGDKHTGEWGAFKYGMCLSLLNDCLTVMSEQQKDVVIGAIRREQERLAA